MAAKADILMARSFTAKIEDEAEARAKGQCEKCGGQLKPGKFHFDHIKAHASGGGSTLDNCQVLCVRCHLEKTLEEDLPPIRKGNKQAKVKKQLPVANGVSEIMRRFGLTE